MKCRVMALEWGVPEIGSPPTALSYVKHWQIFFLSFHSFFSGIPGGYPLGIKRKKRKEVGHFDSLPAFGFSKCRAVCGGQILLDNVPHS